MATELATRGAAMLAPRTLDEAMKFSELLAKSDLVPRDYKGKPGNILVAMQWGFELGLQPLQALQNIACINGRPSIWGDAAMALVRGSGLCESVAEHIEGAGDNAVAVCVAKRKGQAEPIVARFSVTDARKAGLWGKAGPWTQYPARMLAMRARGFCLRDGFADVLRGVITVEEARDYPTEPRDITPAPKADLDAFAAALPSPEAEPEPEPEPHVNQTFLAVAELNADQGADAFRAWWKTLSKGNRELLRPSLDDLQARAKHADMPDDLSDGEDPLGLPPLTEPIRRGLGGESQPEGGRPGEEKPPAPPEQNSQRSDMAAAGVAERRSDANPGGRHVTEPREPFDRAGEALSPGSSDPPPASPAANPDDRKEVMPHSSVSNGTSRRDHNATAPVKAGAAPPIAIVKPHGGEPDWPATRKRLVEAFYDLMTIPDCDAFRLRHSATINALRREAPDEFEIWDTLAATHERVRRVLHGEG